MYTFLNIMVHFTCFAFSVNGVTLYVIFYDLLHLLTLYLWYSPILTHIAVVSSFPLLHGSPSCENKWFFFFIHPTLNGHLGCFDEHSGHAAMNIFISHPGAWVSLWQQFSKGDPETAGVPRTISGGPWGQNNFRDNTEILFLFSTLSLSWM